MTTTLRAAASFISVVALSPARTAFARALERYMDAAHYQTLEFPRCMAAEYAARDQRQPAYAAQQYQYLADAKASLAAALAFNSPTAEVEALRDDVAEIEKEIRKGVWYYSTPVCECATCQPLTPPAPLSTADADLPSRWEVMGEQGADF